MGKLLYLPTLSIPPMIPLLSITPTSLAITKAMVQAPWAVPPTKNLCFCQFSFFFVGKNGVYLLIFFTLLWRTSSTRWRRRWWRRPLRGSIGVKMDFFVVLYGKMKHCDIFSTPYQCHAQEGLPPPEAVGEKPGHGVEYYDLKNRHKTMNFHIYLLNFFEILPPPCMS